MNIQTEPIPGEQERENTSGRAAGEHAHSHYLSLALSHDISLASSHYLSLAHSHDISLAISHYLSLALSHDISLAISHYLSLALSHDISLASSHYLSLAHSHDISLASSHSRSLSRYLTRYLSLSLTRSLSRYLTRYLSLALSHDISLASSHSLSLTISHSLALTLAHSHDISLSLTLAHSLSLSLTISHSLSLSLTHSKMCWKSPPQAIQDQEECVSSSGLYKCVSASVNGCRQNEDWSTVMFLSDSHSDGTHSLMQRHISTILMKKHTPPDLGWPEDEEIFSKCKFFSKSSKHLKASGQVSDTRINQLQRSTTRSFHYKLNPICLPLN